MDSQYSIINQCLHLLKQSNIPTINRLRVEIQLIQMKRLLLNDAADPGGSCTFCGEEPFRDLLSDMRRVCGGGCEGEALAELTERINGMLAMLRENHPT